MQRPTSSTSPFLGGKSGDSNLVTLQESLFRRASVHTWHLHLCCPNPQREQLQNGHVSRIFYSPLTSQILNLLQENSCNALETGPEPKPARFLLSCKRRAWRSAVSHSGYWSWKAEQMLAAQGSTNQNPSSSGRHRSRALTSSSTKQHLWLPAGRTLHPHTATHS